MTTTWVRSFFRLFASNVQTELKSKQQTRDLKFVTGCSGFSKSLTPCSTGPKKWTFGDDSFFIARNNTADVIGNEDGIVLLYKVVVHQSLLFMTSLHVHITRDKFSSFFNYSIFFFFFCNEELPFCSI